MINREVITICLQLANATTLGDKALVVNIIDQINTRPWDEEQEEYILHFIENVKCDKDLNLLLIDNVNLVKTKEYLRLVVELAFARSMEPGRLKEILNMDLEFDSNAARLNFYSFVSSFVMQSNDSMLIKQCIDKIQNI